MTSDKRLERSPKEKRQKAARIASKTGIYVMLVLIAFVMLVPFYWMLLLSFRPLEEIRSSTINLLPTSFTLDHYKAFIEFGAFRFIGNTLIVILVIMVTQLLFCSMAGYSLARLRYPGKPFLVKFFMATMMIPGIISLIPSYMVVNAFGMVDSLWGVFITSTYSIYGCLFMRSFFISTPPEIAEAARIDGASEFRIFMQIYVPMVLPGFLTLALFTFNGSWNNYLWPSLVLPSAEETWGTLAVALNKFNFLWDYNAGNIMAAAVFMSLPSMLIFICGQKYFVENMSFAGVK